MTSQKAVVSPLWGLFFRNTFKILFSTWLFPRYGGYSMEDNSKTILYWSCFPVMGVILAHKKMNTIVKWLFPRYGGYSFCKNTDKIKSFSCFPVMGVIPYWRFKGWERSWLFPRYGGYSVSKQIAKQSGFVTSPLRRLFRTKYKPWYCLVVASC